MKQTKFLLPKSFKVPVDDGESGREEETRCNLHEIVVVSASVLTARNYA